MRTAMYAASIQMVTSTKSENSLSKAEEYFSIGEL